MDEKNYISGLHAGDEVCFREIFEKYHNRLCYFASLHLMDEETPEDVVQEAFIKLWQKRRHFHRIKSIKSFLYIVVRNQCLDIIKHRKVRQKFMHFQSVNAGPEKVQTWSASNDMLEAEVMDKVFKALEELPKGCRNVMFLSYFQNLKNIQVAEELKISVNTVKTQKRRGIQLLRKVLNTSYALFFFLLY